MKFTAIDFETAHGERNSICQIGLVKVVEGKIVDSLNILVQPPNNFYWDRFIDIHGITPSMTLNAPTFDKVWEQVRPFIEGQDVVAHNGIRFDFPVLKTTLEYYGIEEPNYRKLDTYQIYKKGLAKLCKEYQIDLNHHDALSDAKACAELYLRHLRDKN